VPQITTFLCKLEILDETVVLCPETAPTSPIFFYLFPLPTTFAHILISLRFLSSEFVHSAHYFFEMCD
jgi:hypothetical protein